MSSSHDGSVGNEQDPLDDQLDEDDQGGLFGSGSEDDVSMCVIRGSYNRSTLTKQQNAQRQSCTQEVFRR